MAFSRKRDHRSYAQVLTDKRTAVRRGMSQKASNSLVKYKVNSSFHSQVLGSNTVVIKQNGLEKATLPFCPDSGSREVTSIYSPSESSKSVISQDLDSQTIAHSYNDCERS